MSYVTKVSTVSSSPAGPYGSYIGYDNIAQRSDATITVSSEATGFHKEYAVDWRPSTWWKPTATGESWLRITLTKNAIVDYFAVASHDITDSGSTIRLQYSLTGGSSWIDVTDPVPGLKNQVIFEVFDEIIAAEWRIVVNNPTAIAAIGAVSIGKVLDVTKGQKVGFSPAALSRSTDYLTNESNTGLFIGRSVERNGFPGSFTLDLMDPDWIRGEWESFIDHAELRPFFFSWKHELPYTNEAVFAWTSGQIQPPSYDSESTMRVSLSFNSIR